MKTILVLLAGILLTSAQIEQTNEYDNILPFGGVKFDQFDFNLCQVLNQYNKGNELLSPISLKLILEVLREGAKGTTAKEIVAALEETGTRRDIRHKYTHVLESLKKPGEGYSVAIGTKVYLEHNIKPRNAYHRILELYFDTELQRVNFADADRTAQTINQWAEAATLGHIKHLVKPDQMQDLAVLLVNAVYFSGKWETPFKKEQTHVNKFKTGAGTVVDVEFMKTKGSFYYSEPEELPAKIIRLPYEGKKYAMYLVIPKHADGMNKVIDKISPNLLRKLIWNLAESNVKVTMPKFSFDYSVALREVLKQLGITTMFENGDFRGITGGPANATLRVSQAFQRTGIRVDEEGSEVYAATVIGIENKIKVEWIDLVINHPFLFYIEDEPTGTVLFVGKVMDPTVKTVNVHPGEQEQGTGMEVEEEYQPAAIGTRRSSLRSSTTNNRDRTTPSL